VQERKRQNNPQNVGWMPVPGDFALETVEIERGVRQLRQVDGQRYLTFSTLRGVDSEIYPSETEHIQVKPM